MSRELLERIAGNSHQESLSAIGELATLLAQPAEQQGEPIGYIAKAVLEELSSGLHVPATICSGTKSRTNRHPGPDASCDVPIYTQPATAKVVLPESVEIEKPRTQPNSWDDWGMGWNACLDEVAKLNGGG